MARIDAFFKLMHEQGASGPSSCNQGSSRPCASGGKWRESSSRSWTAMNLRSMLYEITPEEKVKVFEETGDLDFGYELPGVARYRANFFYAKIRRGRGFS